jgi:hypothetical protein
MKLIYLDNPLIRSLAEQPETWNALYDQFIGIFGRRFRPVQSCYLFFEYIGFTKKHLKIPTAFKTPHFDQSKELAKINPDLGTINKDALAILDKNLGKIADEISAYTEVKVCSLQIIFEELIEKRKKRISAFGAAQDLVKTLFGDIFSLIETDFAQFAKYATKYLAWDIFCGIHPIGLSPKAIRQRQLGFWLQLWEQGTELPFGKIIDDQSGYYNFNFDSPFKEFEDMVDSELHTYLILGHKIDGKPHPIHGLVYPPKDTHALSKRNELALGVVDNIQKTLRRELEKFPGKLYSLDEKTHAIQEINEPMFVISPQN